MPKRTPFIHKLLKNFDKIDRETLQTSVEDMVEENALYQEILENLEEGVLVIDSKGRLRAMNRQAALWLGITPPAGQNARLSDLLPETDLSRFILRHLDSLNERKVGTFEILSPRELSIQVSLIPLSDASETILILLSNLSRHQDAKREDDLARIEVLVRLAAGIAHEIGNPLNAIGIHLGLLKKQLKELPEAKKAHFERTLDVLNGETSRLDKIIRNFLRATRKPPLRFKTDDLNSILDEALQFMGPELAKNKIAVQFKPDRSLPSFMMDRERLTQAFINLIKNAEEAAMPRGGKLTISTLKKEKAVILRFKDEGQGIPENDLPHIFEAYYTTKEEGSGLGLMTVFNTVREHGGRIEVTSQVGKGSAFTLLLPIREPQLQLPQYKK